MKTCKAFVVDDLTVLVLKKEQTRKNFVIL